MNNRFFVLAVSLVLAAALLAFGSFILWAGGTNFYRGLASVTWPSAEGRIDISRVERSVSSTRSSSGSSRTAVTYYPLVAFSYQAGGGLYASSRINFKSMESESGSEAAVQSFLDQYPVGKRVEVYFDPDNPSRAVLRRGPHFGPFLGVLGIALIFILPGLATVFLAIRGFRKRTQALQSLNAT